MQVVLTTQVDSSLAVQVGTLLATQEAILTPLVVTSALVEALSRQDLGQQIQDQALEASLGVVFLVVELLAVVGTLIPIVMLLAVPVMTIVTLSAALTLVGLQLIRQIMVVHQS